MENRLQTIEGKDKVSHRRRYLQYLHQIALEEGNQAGKGGGPQESLQSTLQRGWYWGSQQFREECLKLVEDRKSDHVNYRSSPLAADQKQKTAQNIIEDGLRISGIARENLKDLKGSHPVKVAIAVALKQQTTLGNPWIAEQLSMKSAGNVSQLARRYRSGDFQLNKEMKQWLKFVKNA